MEHKINRNNNIIATWIFCGVAMIVVQVLLGGITRLTGSGLSITDWKPIMGIIPPLNETQWQQAFEKYQQIAQFKSLNSHFALSDFKQIFFWEWFHRVWARVLLGVAFAVPFAYFYFKKMITKPMIKPLITLVLLGAIEGLIGWLMVKSGLNDENIYVSHLMLSFHFISAMFIACYALVFGLSLLIKPQQKVIAVSLKKYTITLVILLGIQLVYGAFMAGLKGAIAAPTWPSINGQYFPNFFANGIINGLFFNIIGVHFIHRTLAYIICIALIVWWLKAKKIKTSNTFLKLKNLPLILVVLQVALGIAAVLLSPKIVLGSFGVFEWIALLHQLVGMLLLLSLVTNLYLIKKFDN